MSATKQHEPSSLDENDIAVLEDNDGESKRVEAALFELTPEDREIVTLKHREGLTYDELSERREIPLGTVMSRLYRARCRLRDRLEQS